MTRIEELEARIRSLESCIVAFSGGVDSSLVAALAARALGERALAVTAVSPALATGELDGAQGVAEAIGIRHETITTAELEREGYRANGRDRCYHCKTELYESLSALAARKGFRAVLSGANADDVQALESVLDQSGYIVRERFHEMIQNQNKDDYSLETILAEISVIDFVRDGSINSSLYPGDRSRLQYAWSNKAGVAAGDVVSLAFEAVRGLKG